jgi:hypothetical protein
MAPLSGCARITAERVRGYLWINNTVDVAVLLGMKQNADG